MPLACGDVRVWCCSTTSLGRARLHSLATVLSADERARRDRLVFPHDRRDFTAAHGLLRHTLSRYGTTPAADWQFETNGYGKPSIISAQAGTPPLSFNLSHTHGLVACAAAVGVDVGVDVERIDRAAAGCEIADRYLAPSEVAMLNASSGNEYATRFVELWTLKEAYLKALGLGLSCPLHSFAFAFEGDSGLAFHAPPGARACDWYFVLAAPAPGFRLSIAVRCDACSRRRIDMHDVDGLSGTLIRRAYPAFSART